MKLLLSPTHSSNSPHYDVKVSRGGSGTDRGWEMYHVPYLHKLKQALSHGNRSGALDYSVSLEMGLSGDSVSCV